MGKPEFVVRFEHHADPEGDGEISCAVGQIVDLIQKHSDEWWEVQAGSIRGMFPAAYLLPVIESVVALYDYEAQDASEIALVPNEKVMVLEKLDENWWLGRTDSGVGMFPATFVGEHLAIGADLIAESGEVAVLKEEIDALKIELGKVKDALSGTKLELKSSMENVDALNAQLKRFNEENQNFTAQLKRKNVDLHTQEEQIKVLMDKLERLETQQPKIKGKLELQVNGTTVTIPFVK